MPDVGDVAYCGRRGRVASVGCIKRSAMHHFNLSGASRPDGLDAPYGTVPGSEPSKAPNNDIVEFAEGALDLNIPRWEKRSRYELIGLIVCESANLNDKTLTSLVRALAKIIADDPVINRAVEDRKSLGVSWNEMIQLLNER